MLTHSLQRLIDSVLLKFSGDDAIRADAMRSRILAVLMSLIVVTYIPLMLVVIYLFTHHSGQSSAAQNDDQETAVKAYAVRYLNAYLNNPANSDAIKHFYNGEVPQRNAGSALPPGGHATGVSSALPGMFTGEVQTWSVVVDCELPKEAHSASMVYVPLQVDIAVDKRGLFRAFTLPHTRSERPDGSAIELATETAVVPGSDVYNTVRGFLNALLIGHSDITPFIAAGSPMRAAEHSEFASVAIERITANSDLAVAQVVPPKADGIEVTASVSVLSGNGASMPMQYPLLMSVAGGHWQVDRINDAPKITIPDQGSTPAPTPPSSTTSDKPNALQEGS
ncbi:hypothetical protein [Mycobacterium servetii]|uniref:Conjugative transposon protein TcpC n=1 Tax=Mycobacterium servetii TaxID=3237418 RepID=A0ABV4C9A2_9MYCO